MKNFRETRLPESFAKNTHATVKELLTKGQSFSIIGMPSIGVAPFFEFLASQNYAYFIHLNMYELPEFTKEEFLKLFYYKITSTHKKNPTFSDCRAELMNLLKKNKRIVVIVNKFSLLSHEFDSAFFGNFRTLCHGTEGKISFLFSTIKPYIEYNEEALVDSNLHIFSRYVYFTPYSKEDLLELVKLNSPELLNKKNLSKALTISGGHIQILQLVLKSETPNMILHDPYVRLLLKQILETLSPLKQKMLKKITEGKKIEIDPYLLHLGMVHKTHAGYKIFSPLLQEYLLEKKIHHLPAKEYTLLQFLKRNKGKIISSQRIFETVWKDNPHDASNWALDSLMYRLRRHPVLKEKGFTIRNHKKLGYQLVKEN